MHQESSADVVRNFEIGYFPAILVCYPAPYGKEIEPYVPDKSEVLQSVKQLSGIVGTKAVGWLPAAAPDVHRLILMRNIFWENLDVTIDITPKGRYIGVVR